MMMQYVGHYIAMIVHNALITSKSKTGKLFNMNWNINIHYTNLWDVRACYDVFYSDINGMNSSIDPTMKCCWSY